jgi:hypothetical protein
MNKQAIEDHIRNGDIEAALQALMDNLEQKPSASALYQEALGLSATLKDGQRQVARGIIDPAHYQSIRSRAVAGIQEIVQQMENPSLPIPIKARYPGATKIGVGAALLVVLALLWGYFRPDWPSHPNENQLGTVADTAMNTETTEARQPDPTPTKSSAAPPASASQSSKPPQPDIRRDPEPHPVQPDDPGPAKTNPIQSVEVKVLLNSVDCRLKVNGQEPDVTAGHNTQKRSLRLPVGEANFTVICGAKVCSFTRNITAGMPDLNLNCQ